MRMVTKIVNLKILFINKLCAKFINILKRQEIVFNGKKILENSFPVGSKFTILQVGANDGVSFDFLHEIIKTRKTTGVMIEPVPTYFNQLCENFRDYNDILKINKAIHKTKSKETIYKVKENCMHKYPDWVKGIASFDKDHFKNKVDNDDIETVSVQCDNLMNIVAEHIKEVDYLQIDTEGYDAEIIKQIDFKKFKPKMIKFEFVNLNREDYYNTLKLLKSNGYFSFKDGNDVYSVDINRIKLS